MLNQLIAIERAEIGTRERGANYVKYNDWYWGNGVGGDAYPWCVVFQAWCADKAGIPFPHVAHCNQVESYAKSHEQWVTKDYKVGDFVIFDYNSDGNRDHIGFVVGVSGNRLNTIEGNYADAVASVVRSAAEIVGAYRPDYKIATGDDLSQVEDVNTKADDVNADVDVPDINVGNKTPSELPRLETGDYEPAVGVLQCALHYVWGYKMPGSFYANGKPDCEFGDETESVLRDFCGKTEVTAEDWIKIIGGI